MFFEEVYMRLSVSADNSGIRLRCMGICGKVKGKALKMQSQAGGDILCVQGFMWM
jgi:hypothetical protein